MSYAPRLIASRAPGRRLPAHERLAGVRLASGALRRAAVGRARVDAGRPRDHQRRGPRRAARARSRVAEEVRDGTFAFGEGDEDVHMAIERRVTELAGEAGGTAAHSALAQRPGRHRHGDVHPPGGAGRGCGDARARGDADRPGRAPHRLADAGYTHLQRAQPVYLGHHLLAYAWMLLRDERRFGAVLDGTGALPLGAGALAGVNFDTDRELRRRASSASPASPRTRSTRSRTGTSCSTTWRPQHLRHAPLAARRRDRALVQ